MYQGRDPSLWRSVGTEENKGKPIKGDDRQAIRLWLIELLYHTLPWGISGERGAVRFSQSAKRRSQRGRIAAACGD